MSKDLLLNECGDIKIENGDAVIIDGADQIKQRWLIHMRTFLGEWFLDQSRGMPYIQEIFTKIISKAKLKRIFKDESLKVEGIERVTSITIGDIDPTTRSVDFIEVECDLVDSEDHGLFVFSGEIPPGGCDLIPAADYPKTIGDLRMWFDAQDLANMTYTPASNLLELANKAGQGKAVGAGIGVNIPTVVGVSPIGNKRSIYFDYTNEERLEIADTQAIRHGANDLSAFIVIKANNMDGAYLGLFGLTGYNTTSAKREFYGSGHYYTLATDDATIDWRDGEAGSSSVVTSPAQTSDAMLLSYIVDSSNNVNIYRNGSLIKTGAMTKRYLDGDGFIGALVDPTTGIGPVGFFAGYIGELLVYNGEIAGDDLDNLHAFLTDKWSL